MAYVARSVSKKEIREVLKAAEACISEWKRLEAIGAWDVNGVREWQDVDWEARLNGETIHIGALHEICVEKGSELPDGDVWQNCRISGNAFKPGCPRGRQVV